MNDEELISYFEHSKLPHTLRLDRASTQCNVKEAVERNMKSMLADPKDMHSWKRLKRIAAAMEHP